MPWSAALRCLFGVDPAERGWRGGPLFNSRVSPDDGARLRAAIQRLIVQGEPIDVRYVVRTDEMQRCIQMRAETYPAMGRLVFGVFKDCSAESFAERQRQVTQERLQTVGRLTLLGEVASGLAHDLNQPLAAIATFAQAGERLLKLPEPRVEKAVEVFREVSQQALRAGEIIRHMRSLIRRRAAQPEKISAERLMNDFLTLAEPMARVGQVQLVVQMDAADRQVLVDVPQIHQAMMILFQNALDASRERQPARQPQVRVALLALDAGLEWAIEDQGPGISETVAAQIFQPFFSTKESGTGLGLISCRNILEAHGCRLSFANLHEGGCRFCFVLPYAPSA